MNGSVVFARWHYCAPHLIHVSLVQPECKSQTTFRLVQLFLHSSQQSIPIIYSGLPLASSKLPVTMGHLDPHALAWFFGGSLGPLESSTQTALNRFSHFAGLTTVTDRSTDRPCCSICNNRPYLRDVA